MKRNGNNRCVVCGLLYFSVVDNLKEILSAEICVRIRVHDGGECFVIFSDDGEFIGVQESFEAKKRCVDRYQNRNV